MSQIVVTTPFNIDLEFKVAAFHKRLLAWFVDMVIIIAYVFVLQRLLLRSYMAESQAGALVFYLFVFSPAYTYHLVSEILMNGQTIGKKALNIKVVDKTGKGVTLSQYLIRWVFRLIDISFTMGAAAVLSIGVSTYSQRLGDILAGTVVIDNAQQTKLHHTIYLDISETDYKVSFPAVMRLTDRDINGVRKLLDMKGRDAETVRYKEQIAEKIKQVLEIETDMESHNFLHTLLADYNYLTSK